MSIKIMGRVFDSDLRSTLRLVMLAYADHASHDGTNVFPSVDLIAKKTGLTRRAVQLSTRELEGLGWLIDDGTGPHGTRRWRIPPYMPVAEGESDSPHESHALRGEPHDLTPEHDSPEPSFKHQLNANIKRNQNIWTKVLLSVLQNQYGHSPYARPPKDYLENWEPTFLDAETEGLIRVACESQDQVDWLNDRGKTIAEKTLAGIAGERLEIEFIYKEAENGNPNN